MTEVLIVAIWDKGPEVYTRNVVITPKTKGLKFMGKKPNKVIVPESCNKSLLTKIKNIVSYNAQIIKAKGK